MARVRYSNPVIEREVTFYSEYAQRTYTRAQWFHRVSRALHATDVILRIIGNDNEIDVVEQSINTMIAEWVKEAQAERARLQELRRSNAVTDNPTYTKPLHDKIKIMSPQVSKIVEIITFYDAMVQDVDALWMAQVFTNKQRREFIHTWMQRILRLGNKIVEIEQRAHRAAKNANKEAEVKASLDHNGSGDDAAEENSEADAKA